MESYIPISFLNDYIFCPRSIYFHQLYGSRKTSVYNQKPQIEGKAAHSSIDNATYSTRKDVLQGIDIFSERFGLCGKIDVFNIKTGVLTERKKEVKHIYDGYIFQVYAHFHALQEMGYKVKAIIIHCLSHNRNYPIALPSEMPEMQLKFEATVQALKEFDMLKSNFKPELAKCQNCIYSNLCDFSLC